MGGRRRPECLRPQGLGDQGQFVGGGLSGRRR
uniref:Uncharacterized protein n=1 Tax=Siphoviridae sp. ctR5S1 TaxID=2825498 RepID=A0A8S5Q162_9CAUD|nr:MAG TPA: hypothetical protein [Siphoviridae sp. ctR5S1]